MNRQPQTAAVAFPLAGVARTRNGLVRVAADGSAPGMGACGCGTHAVVVLIIQRVRGRSGARTSNTSRVPLCARHQTAHIEQNQRKRSPAGGTETLHDRVRDP